MASITKKIKAIIYCRVSSKEQEDTGYSLDAQEKLLKEYAEKNNFRIEKIYRITESASGKQIRKTFIEMLQYTTKNKIPVILCEKIDRLTRNLKDASTTDEWVKGDLAREVHFIKESFVLNQNTKAHENLVWDMKVAIARFYTNNLSEEVRKGQKEKLAQGWLPTKPPLGYKTIGEKGHKIHIIDEDVARHIRLMFEWYATGNYSLARLEKELYEAGLRSRSGKKLGISRIHLLLQDPFYISKMSWRGQISQGKQESLINKDIFDKVQILIKRKTTSPTFTKHNSLFKSKIFCVNCGGMLTWYIKKGNWYGHCNNHGEYKKCSKKTCIRQDKVEEQYSNIFDVIAPKNEEVLSVIEKILIDEHNQKIGEREKEVQRLNGLLFNVRKQKDKYFEAKINKEVPMDYCERRIAESTKEEEALEDSLIKIGNKNDEYLQLGLAVHELAYKSKEIYEKATVDEKRLLLSQLFTNLTQDEHIVRQKLAPAIEFLEKWMPKVSANYELANSPMKTAPNGAEINTWLPR